MTRSLVLLVCGLAIAGNVLLVAFITPGPHGLLPIYRSLMAPVGTLVFAIPIGAYVASQAPARWQVFALFIPSPLYLLGVLLTAGIVAAAGCFDSVGSIGRIAPVAWFAPLGPWVGLTFHLLGAWVIHTSYLLAGFGIAGAIVRLRAGGRRN